MILLEAFNIEKSYGDRLIFRIPELRVYTGDRIGIVGTNGAGKSTLMDVLCGKLEPDEGRCTRHSSMSYIQQFSNEISRAKGKELTEFALKGKTHRSALSGGEQARVKITNALSDHVPIIFADEPTANLDRKGIALLLEKLAEIETLVLISHDRSLLDSLCNRIIELKDGGIKEYSGNYSEYQEQSRAEFKRANQEYEQYRDEKRRLEQMYTQKKAKAKSATKRPKGMSDSEYKMRRFTAGKAFSVKEKNMERSANAIKSRLDQLEVKDKPKEVTKIKLDIGLTDPPQNKVIFSAKGLNFSYGTNTVFTDAEFTINNRSKTALIGENGAGKTTLFNLIAREDSAINKVPKAKVGYFHQDFGNLDPDKTILDNVMSTSVQDQTAARCILARLLFEGETVFKKAGVLSGGEKIKLSLAKLLTSDTNVLLLDEPTNYLDIYSIEAVQELLVEYEGTLLLISHDKAFVDAISNQLLIIEGRHITLFSGNLSDYESRDKKKEATSGDRLLLEMQLTKVISDLSTGRGNQNVLEEEYKRLTAALNSR